MGQNMAPRNQSTKVLCTLHLCTQARMGAKLCQQYLGVELREYQFVALKYKLGMNILIL